MRGVLLDRDGVLNENRSDYVKSWAEFRWLEGALAALATLAATPWPVVVVTNQSAVGRGLLSAAGLAVMHQRMCGEAAASGGRIDGVYACLHAPSDHCACRKPLPGLLHAAARDHDLDLADSLLIGDSFTDFQAAHAAGVAYIHVCTGRGQDDVPRVAAADPTTPIASDLRAAVGLVVAIGERRTELATV